VNDRVALIVNPIATRSGPQLREQAVRLLTPLGLTDVAETTRTGDGVRLAEAALAAGATLVVAMGGDGTVNEVATTLAGTRTALAVLPAGSTNVFARAIGWPHPARVALPVLIAALGDPQFRDVTLGRVTYGEAGRVFCVNAGTGLDADTIHLVERHTWVKTKFRNLGVGGATLIAAARASRHPSEISVTVDDEPSRRLATLLVACGAPYAYLGPRPLDLVPGAAFDGRLRWLGLQSPRFSAAGRAAIGALRGGGRHLQQPSVVDGWAEREILVTAEHPVAVQADGEPLGLHTDVRMSPGPVLRALIPGTR
jgi:diacylglycerol kinase family enzyme